MKIVTNLFDIIIDLANIGSFIIAGIIALIGIIHTKKKNSDRVYEYLEKILEVKRMLELSLNELIEDGSVSNFTILNTEYTYFVNSIEYFSSKIVNQKLFKTKAFRDFQGKDSDSFKDIIRYLLVIYNYIEENRYNSHGIKQSHSTTSRNLSNTFVLLKLVLTPQSYEEIIEKCEEYNFNIEI